MFPKIMVPPNHSLKNEVFHYKPSISWGIPIFENTHIKPNQISMGCHLHSCQNHVRRKSPPPLASPFKHRVARRTSKVMFKIHEPENGIQQWTCGSKAADGIRRLKQVSPKKTRHHQKKQTKSEPILTHCFGKRNIIFPTTFKRDMFFFFLPGRYVMFILINLELFEPKVKKARTSLPIGILAHRNWERFQWNLNTLPKFGGERYRKNTPCSSSDVSVVGSIGLNIHYLSGPVGGFFRPIWKICERQIGAFPPNFGMNIKNLWNHQPILPFSGVFSLGDLRNTSENRRRSHWSVQRCRGSLRSLGAREVTLGRCWGTSTVGALQKKYISF